MKNTEDCDTAHLMWSKIAETFLLTWALIESPQDIYDGAQHVAKWIIDHDRDVSTRSQATPPSLTRGFIADTITTPNTAKVHNLTVLASNYKAQALAKLDRQCKQLLLMSKRLQQELATNFEARSLDTRQVPRPVPKSADLVACAENWDFFPHPSRGPWMPADLVLGARYQRKSASAAADANTWSEGAVAREVRER